MSCRQTVPTRMTPSPRTNNMSIFLFATCTCRISALRAAICKILTFITGCVPVDPSTCSTIMMVSSTSLRMRFICPSYAFTHQSVALGDTDSVRHSRVVRLRLLCHPSASQRLARSARVVLDQKVLELLRRHPWLRRVCSYPRVARWSTQRRPSMWFPRGLYLTLPCNLKASTFFLSDHHAGKQACQSLLNNDIYDTRRNTIATIVMSF